MRVEAEPIIVGAIFISFGIGWEFGLTYGLCVFGSVLVIMGIFGEWME